MLEKRLQSISQHADICRSGTFQCLKNAWEDMGTNFPALHNRFDLGCERCDLSRAKTIILSNDLAKTIGRVIGGLCIASTRFRIENVGGHRFIVEIMPDCQCLKFRGQRWANVIRRQSVSKVQCEHGNSLLNLTITTRQTVKTDIQQRCKRRLKSIFYTWDDASLNTASQTCIERAPRLDGVSVLLALNPNAYEINNFLAYLMLDKIYEDTGKNYCLIHLDSYRHWFDAKNPDEEQKIPDFLVVAVDSDAAGKTVLHATVAECKIAKCIHKDEHIQKAKSQVENGISVLKAHFSPDSKSIERRYWYAQLYRALAFTRTDSRTSKLLDAIIDGEFDIDWSGEIYGFWFDSDDEQDTLYTDYSGAQDIIVHNICQKTIQRVLLKKTPSEEVEFIREIGALEQEDEPANEEFDALDDDFSETVHEDDAITMPDTQEDKRGKNCLF